MTVALTGASSTTADHLGITMKVTMPAGGDVRFPSFGDRLGGFSVEEAVESYPMLLEDGLVLFEKKIMCRPLLPGDYTIPDITAAFTLMEGGSGEITVPGRIIEVTAAAPAGRDSPGLLDVLGFGRRGDAVPAFLLSVMVLLAAGVFVLRKLKLKLKPCVRIWKASRSRPARHGRQPQARSQCLARQR